MTDQERDDIRLRALNLCQTPTTTLLGQATAQLAEDNLLLLSEMACLMQDMAELKAAFEHQHYQLLHERKMRSYAEADAEQLRRGILEHVRHFPSNPTV